MCCRRSLLGMEEIAAEIGMKKILNIVPYTFLPYTTGGQKLIAHFNAYLGKKSELHVAGTTDNDASLANSYTFHPLLSKSRWRYVNVFSCFKSIRLIRTKKIETVIIEHPYLGWMILFFRMFTNVKIICHTHNVESQRFRSIGKKWWRLLSYYEKIVLRHCDKIFCITEEDRDFFVHNMNILEEKCLIVPYGVNEKHPPDDKEKSKHVVCEKHQLNPDLPLLFFNGALDYQPNREALDIILHKIHPQLQSKDFKCNILIAGRNLPASYKHLQAYNHSNILYTGFVEDISMYTKAADILLNPVKSGGGVKTKMIEALALNTSVISTKTGAAGISPEEYGQKMKTVSDGDWNAFANEIIKLISMAQASTPNAFYEKYFWGNIIENMLTRI